MPSRMTAETCLRSWLAQSSEDRIQAIVEDPSIMNTVEWLLYRHDLYLDTLRCFADRGVAIAREVIEWEGPPTRVQP